MEAVNRNIEAMKIQNLWVNFGRWLERHHKKNTAFAYEDFMEIYDYEREMTEDEIKEIHKMCDEILCFIKGNEADEVLMYVDFGDREELIDTFEEFLELIGMNFKELKDNLVEARYINETGYTMYIKYNKNGYEKELVLGIV
ncbi:MULTISPECIES: hypothetical protein [unclassified Clostridium]|uniref:hypothetical protein n=1 Tax=unclassified Clostridium TaxID=2614128 RepID=UPI002079CEB7|nr:MULTISPECIES: hypothetical protein [unclassified Clostridium]